MAHRFRFLATANASDQWSIAGEEAFHLKRVLRLNVGDTVEVFDGKGRLATGTLQTVTDKEALITAEPAQISAPPTSQLVLALGALKPSLVDELLPGLVEVGLDELWLWQQEGTDKHRLQDKQLERWQRIIIAATKQSKRVWLPEVRSFASQSALLEHLPSMAFANKYVLSPDGQSSILAAPLVSGPTLAVVGGERGLEAAETAAFTQRGFQAVSAGPYILRAITAALGSCHILAVRLNDL